MCRSLGLHVSETDSNRPTRNSASHSIRWCASTCWADMFSYLFINIKSAIKKFTLYLLTINKNAIFCFVFTFFFINSPHTVFGTYLIGSCMRKQSLTIFHLSPWAVTVKFCWNGRDVLSWNFTNPQTRIRNVSWLATAISEIKSVKQFYSFPYFAPS
jgi:hypothetical protein